MGQVLHDLFQGLSIDTLIVYALAIRGIVSGRQNSGAFLAALLGLLRRREASSSKK